MPGDNEIGNDANGGEVGIGFTVPLVALGVARFGSALVALDKCYRMYVARNNELHNDPDLGLQVEYAEGTIRLSATTERGKELFGVFIGDFAGEVVFLSDEGNGEIENLWEEQGHWTDWEEEFLNAIVDFLCGMENCEPTFASQDVSVPFDSADIHRALAVLRGFLQR